MSSVLTFRKGAYYPGTSQGITTSGSTQAFAALQPDTSIIRVAVNQDTYISLSGPATAASLLMPAGSVEFFAVEATTVVAALQVTTAGRVSLTELTNI
jgi:hypothetical protein